MYPGTVPLSLLIYLWELSWLFLWDGFEMDYFIGRRSRTKAEWGLLKIRKMQIFLEQKNIPRRIPLGIATKESPSLVCQNRPGRIFI